MSGLKRLLTVGYNSSKTIIVVIMDHQINHSDLTRLSGLNKYITDRSMDVIPYGRLIPRGHNDEWS